MKVNNASGTSQCTCKCGSWLRHWERFTGLAVPQYCPVEHCLEKDIVGAHVKKAESADKNRYIIPLCNKHNKATDTLSVEEWCRPAPANVEKTCG